VAQPRATIEAACLLLRSVRRLEAAYPQLAERFLRNSDRLPRCFTTFLAGLSNCLDAINREDGFERSLRDLMRVVDER